MKRTVEAVLTTHSLSQAVSSNESCLTHDHLSGVIQALCYNLEVTVQFPMQSKGLFIDSILPPALWAWR